MSQTKKNVYMFQPNGLARPQEKMKRAWLPYSAGSVWSYVNQFEDISSNFELKDLIFFKTTAEEVLYKVEQPAVCAFSSYVWNINWNLYISRLIKQRWPDCVIVFGGPQVSGRYLNQSQIDSIIMGEGEEPFLELLRDVLHQRPVQTFYKQSRLEKLDYPSPYTAGVFDKIVADHPDWGWNAVIETSRGCPYHCTFCDWGGVTYSKVKKFEIDRVREDIAWMATHNVETIWGADANFGIFRDRDLAVAKMIREIASWPSSRINDVQFQWAKNSNDTVFEIAKALGPHCIGLTLSLQSESENTLQAIKRTNMKSQNLMHMLELSEQHQVPTYTELIMALPEETLESWKQGLANVLEMGQHGHIDVYLASLLENSELSLPESRKKFGIKSVKYAHGDRGLPDEAQEVTEFVASTNTMTTDEIAEGWAYAWMYQNVQSTGYTQIIAKYLRFVHNISYRDFYDQMYEQLKTSSIFKDIISRTHDHMKYRLDETFRPDPPPVQVAYYESMDVSRVNFDHLVDLAVESARVLGIDVPASVIDFQRAFIFNPDKTYPIIMDIEYDLKTWKPVNQTVEITPKGLGIINLLTRRIGVMKNNVKVVDCKRPNQ